MRINESRNFSMQIGAVFVPKCFHCRSWLHSPSSSSENSEDRMLNYGQRREKQFLFGFVLVMQ